MPKFKVVVSEVVYYRGEIEAETATEAVEIALEMDEVSEFDSSTPAIEEVTPISEGG